VTGETQIVFVPQVNISAGIRPRSHGSGGWGSVGSGGKIGGAGSDGKAAAVALIAIAATALVTAAVIEGSRFDGYAQLHPMHPVHLIGKDGNYTVVPLAWLDANTAAWADSAVVRPTEGPWLQLERAPLSRRGITYGMYAGTGSLRSADGTLAMGPAWTIQLGVFPTSRSASSRRFLRLARQPVQRHAVRDRTTGELQVMPVQLGILHAGLYGGAGSRIASRTRSSSPATTSFPATSRRWRWSAARCSSSTSTRGSR